MVSYKENPSLKYKKVETARGQVEYLKNCRKIGENYYTPDECSFISGKWYANDDPEVMMDHETNQLFIEKNRGRRIHGVIDIDNNNQPVYGYFTPNVARNVKYIDNVQRAQVIALSEDIFYGHDTYIENVSEGIWYSYETMTPDIKKKCAKVSNYYDWTVKKYNVEENVNEFKLKTVIFEKYPHSVKEYHERYGKFLNYSFGVEFEVQQGFIPEHIQHRYGVIICRDGSINGGMEAVTIPKSGSKGLCSLHQLCEYTKSRVTLDINCSMHLHLGGYPRDKDKIVALWMLCTQIQDDVFDFLPPYKRHWEGFKKKNYCKELDTFGIQAFKDASGTRTMVDRCYGKIFNFLSDFKMDISQYQDGTRHPSGHKWDIENRKTWANFINMFFSPRYTVEFRAHQATFNPVKTINWLFICNAILRYAQINSELLLTDNKRISLKNVLSVYAEEHPNDIDAKFLSQYLIAYVDSRKEEFNKALIQKDYPCNWDLKEDSLYDFLVSDKNLLM